LTVSIGTGASASNRVTFIGRFSLSGNNVLLDETTVIGTLNASGGVGTTLMIISFNAAATASRVQLLVRSLRFRTIGGGADVRILRMTLTDGDRETSITA